MAAKPTQRRGSGHLHKDECDIDHGWGFYVYGIGPTRCRLSHALSILRKPDAAPIELEYAGSVLKARRSTIEHCIEAHHFSDPDAAREEYTEALDRLRALEERFGAEIGKVSEDHMHRVADVMDRLRTQRDDEALLRSLEAKVAGR